jgi:hypothetical protein
MYSQPAIWNFRVVAETESSLANKFSPRLVPEGFGGYCLDSINNLKNKQEEEFQKLDLSLKL